MDEGKHSLIAGPTGGGKSFFAGSHIESCYQEKKPLLIFDTKTKNHIGLMALKKMRLLKIKPGYSYDFERVLEHPYVLVIPSPEMRTKALISVYDELLNTAYDARDPRRIYVEEAHHYKDSDIIELFMREGRGFGIDMTLIDQRIQNMPKILWSQCQTTYLTRWNIPQDIKYIGGMIPGFQEINQKLQRHDILRYDHNTGKYQIIKAGKVIRRTKHYG